MAECVDDCDSYIKLTDAVFYDILNQEDSDAKPGLKKAKAIIQRIEERDLYPAVLNEELTLVMIFYIFFYLFEIYIYVLCYSDATYQK